MLAGPVPSGRLTEYLIARTRMTVSSYFDRIAIALSAVCIVHCLTVPVIVAVLPIAAVSLGDDAHFHELMLWLVIPTSVLGFGLGVRVHRNTTIPLTGAAGVAIIVAATIWGHGRWPEWLEVSVSVAGSLILGFAHWQNFRDVRRMHRHPQPFAAPHE